MLWRQVGRLTKAPGKVFVKCYGDSFMQKGLEIDLEGMNSLRDILQKVQQGATKKRPDELQLICAGTMEKLNQAMPITGVHEGEVLLAMHYNMYKYLCEPIGQM